MKARINKQARRIVPLLENSSLEINNNQRRKMNSIPFTTRLLERSAKRAGKRASINAMNIAGYVIKAEDGWIVREDINGTITRISEIEKVTVPIRFD